MKHSYALKKLSYIIDRYSYDNNDSLLTYKTLEELSEQLNLSSNNQYDWDAIFAWVSKYLEYSLNTAHPNFVNRMWSGANLPSIIGEIVTAFSNTSSCTFESAPVATLMEKYMINEMLNLVGFTQGEGQMTTGSSNANMIAMMIARNKTIANAKQVGLFGHKTLYAFVSKDAHYSIDKAVNILGIGTDNLIKIDTDNDGFINIKLLEKSIKNVVKSGGIAFFVSATLGTTIRGSYDSIKELLKLKNKYNFWLHGDGAWGGAAIMSDYLRQKFLIGVEYLDSITIDFHKMLGTNLMCNFMLVNKYNLLIKTFADGDNSYIFRNKKQDIGFSSLQCGRRVDSLKWFLDWKFYTQKGFADRVVNYYKLASFASSFVEQSSDLEMMAKHISFNVCFRFKTRNIDKNNFTERLRTRLLQKKIGLLSLAYIGKNLVFRLAISNTNINKNRLKQLFNRLIIEAKILENDN